MVYIEQRAIPAPVWWMDGKIYIGSASYIKSVRHQPDRRYLMLGFDASEVLPPNVSDGTIEVVPCTTRAEMLEPVPGSGAGLSRLTWPEDRVTVTKCTRRTRNEEVNIARFLGVWYGMVDKRLFNEVGVFGADGTFTDDAVVALTLVVTFGWFRMTYDNAVSMAEGIIYEYLRRGDVLSERYLVMVPRPHGGWKDLSKIYDFEVDGERIRSFLTAAVESSSRLSPGAMRRAISSAEWAAAKESPLTALVVCEDGCRRLGIRERVAWIHTPYPLAPIIASTIGLAGLPKCIRLAVNRENGWTSLGNKLVYVRSNMVMRSYKVRTSLMGVATLGDRLRDDEGRDHSRTAAARIEGDSITIELCRSGQPEMSSISSAESGGTLWDDRLPYTGQDDALRRKLLYDDLQVEGVGVMVSAVAAVTILDTTQSNDTIKPIAALLSSAGTPHRPPTADESVSLSALLGLVGRVARDDTDDIGLGYTTNAQREIFRTYLSAHKRVSLILGAQYLELPTDVQVTSSGSVLVSIRSTRVRITYFTDSDTHGSILAGSLSVEYAENGEGEVFSVRQVISATAACPPKAFFEGMRR